MSWPRPSNPNGELIFRFARSQTTLFGQSTAQRPRPVAVSVSRMEGWGTMSWATLMLEISPWRAQWRCPQPFQGVLAPYTSNHHISDARLRESPRVDEDARSRRHDDHVTGYAPVASASDAARRGCTKSRKARVRGGRCFPPTCTRCSGVGGGAYDSSNPTSRPFRIAS